MSRHTWPLSRKRWARGLTGHLPAGPVFVESEGQAQCGPAFRKGIGRDILMGLDVLISIGRGIPSIEFKAVHTVLFDQVGQAPLEVLDRFRIRQVE